MREHVEDFLQKSMMSARSRRVFNGGDVTSNGGVVLLRRADRRLDLTAAVARGLADDRQRGKVRHRFVDMLRQRVFGIALGYSQRREKRSRVWRLRSRIFVWIATPGAPSRLARTPLRGAYAAIDLRP